MAAASGSGGSETRRAWAEPEWAADPAPGFERAGLHVEKDGARVCALSLAPRAVLLGRSPPPAASPSAAPAAPAALHVAKHASVSRQHAAFVHWAEGVRVVDLGSTHGTFLNGERLAPWEPSPLRDGDVVTLGSSSRKYLFRVDAGPGQRQPRKLKRAAPQSPGGAAAKRRRVDKGGETVRARHILVKHAKSRRPSSWRAFRISITPEEALQRARELREEVLRAAREPGRTLESAFSELATRESDCSSAKRGGDLGVFGRGKMQPPFEAATFALGVGELSNPVASDSGVHIILRTA